MKPRSSRPPLLAIGLLGLALLMAACATDPSRDAAHAAAASSGGAPDAGDDPLRWAIDYHNLVQGMDAAHATQQWTQLRPTADEEIFGRMQRAILLAHPRAGDPQRALTLLASVLASRTPEALALHPFARLLSQQIAERQRLEVTAERLTRQLERTGQELNETRHRNARLEEKLEALTEIERSLPARPPATPLPTMPDRRN